MFCGLACEQALFEMWARVMTERDSQKHANTSIYERAYERDSHKYANTSI